MLIESENFTLETCCFIPFRLRLGNWEAGLWWGRQSWWEMPPKENRWFQTKRETIGDLQTLRYIWMGSLLLVIERGKVIQAAGASY